MQIKCEQTLPKIFISHLKHAKLMIHILKMGKVTAFHNKIKYHMELIPIEKLKNLKIYNAIITAPDGSFRKEILSINIFFSL